jgi:hypothetical protein
VADNIQNNVAALATPRTLQKVNFDWWEAACFATVIAAGPGTRISITVVTRKNVYSSISMFALHLG